ncbi:MAG: cytochrome b/b6 domain-containing protein [Pseudomonadota bacterium]
MATRERTTRDGRVLVYRHPWLVRAAHWVNALCLLILLFSGLQILNAHPHFYWGQASHFATPAFNVGPVPGWLTLPGYADLGAGRRWHFFFAWIFVINGLLWAAFAIARRTLWPSRAQLRDIGGSVIDHLRGRFAHGEDAVGYNVLQKLSYVAVLFGLLPLMVLTGLAMSPGTDAALPWLTQVAGRQTMRTIHFLSASGLVLFLAVHLAMVVAAGPINEMRSILTGWFSIGRRTPPPASKEEAAHDLPS